jgi:alpha-tubulin suppressor-like RCC1 family protein
VYTWGINNYGQLGNGDGTRTNQFSPVAVQTTAVLANIFIKKIASGGNHALVLSSAGLLYGWYVIDWIMLT